MHAVCCQLTIKMRSTFKLKQYTQIFVSHLWREPLSRRSDGRTYGRAAIRGAGTIWLPSARGATGTAGSGSDPASWCQHSTTCTLKARNKKNPSKRRSLVENYSLKEKKKKSTVLTEVIARNKSKISKEIEVKRVLQQGRSPDMKG